MFEVVPAAAGDEKVASVLSRIYKERPEHWPYGLTPAHFDQGDLYAIRKEGAVDPVGFVGWQSRNLDMLKVGMYSIGLLPEWRGKGLAKKAVAGLLKRKAATVDCLAALVVGTNEPSKALAASLGIPVLEKQAMSFARKALQWAASAGSRGKAMENILKPLGTASAIDILGHHGHGVIGGTVTGNRDNWALADFGLNLITPGLATRYGRGLGLQGQALKNLQNKAVLGSGVKTLAVTPFLNINHRRNDIMDEQAEAIGNLAEAVGSVEKAPPASPAPSGGGTSPWAVLAGAGLVAAGLGGAGWLVRKAIQDKAEAPINIQSQDGGRLRVTLPTENPGDSQTVVDLPFDAANDLTNALRNRIKLDTKRRLYAETKARVKHRGKKLNLQVN